MLVAGALLLGLVLGVAFALGLAERLDRERRRATDAHAILLGEALTFERSRVRDLAGMLDQATADRLRVAPPESVHTGPAETPLPPEMLAELEALDSDAARAEYELVFREAIRLHPEKTTAELIAAVMPA
jgi:hypothetical protein